MLFFWTFYSLKNPEEEICCGFHKNIKQHNFFNIDEVNDNITVLCILVK